MDRIRNRKIGLIEQIAQMLMMSQDKLLTVNDFDILYELDVDELENVKHEILKQYSIKPR